MSTTSEIVRILTIDTGHDPIRTEHIDVSSDNPAAIKKAVLDGINRFGKNAHALISFRGKWFVADHTAQRGPSSDYVKSEVHYHPFMEEMV